MICSPKYYPTAKVVNDYTKLLYDIELEESINALANKPGLYRVEWTVRSTGYSSHGEWLPFTVADETTTACNTKYPWIEHRVVKCSD